MKFNPFKRKKAQKKDEQAKQAKDDIFLISSPKISELPQIFQGLEPYESDSDRFAPFDEDAFAGEDYKSTKTKKIIPPPKTPTSFFAGVFCASLLVLALAGGIAFLSLFSRFGGIYREITIPKLTALTEEQAFAVINDNKDFLQCAVVYEKNPSVPNGEVISQSPTPYTRRKLYGLGKKISVTLTVSKSDEPITLPNLSNQNARDVLLELNNAGINVITQKKHSSSTRAGLVISSSPAEGSLIYENDTVILNVSLGAEQKYQSAPNLIGLSESSAISKIKAEGLSLGDVSYERSELPFGTVIMQSVNAGEAIRSGDELSLLVSLGDN